MIRPPDPRASSWLRAAAAVSLLWWPWIGAGLDPTESLDVRAFGAKGDGRTDDRAAIQRALDAAGDGEVVWFPPTASGYLVTGAIRPRSGTTLAGAGRGSVLRMPEKGWDVQALPATRNYGLVAIEGQSNIRITGLRFHGAMKTPSLPDGSPNYRFNPQLIQLSNTADAIVDDVVIDHCWFESNRVNAIWEGGPTPGPRRVSITDNVFDDIGWEPSLRVPPGVAVQATFSGAVISRNVFRRVAGAIAATGEDLVVSDNVIREVLAHGIMTGDQRVLGNVTITGNVVVTHMVGRDWGNVLALRGISIGNTWPGERVAHGFVVANNVVDLTIGTRALNEVVAFAVIDTTASLASNSVTIRFAAPWQPGDGLVRAFKLGASERDAAVTLVGNTVTFVAPPALGPEGRVYGFVAAPLSRPGALTILSSANSVRGLLAGPGPQAVAWDFFAANEGLLKVSCRDDLATGGLTRIGEFVEHHGEPFTRTWRSGPQPPRERTR